VRPPNEHSRLLSHRGQISARPENVPRWLALEESWRQPHLSKFPRGNAFINNSPENSFWGTKSTSYRMNVNYVHTWKTCLYTQYSILLSRSFECRRLCPTPHPSISVPACKRFCDQHKDVSINCLEAIWNVMAHAQKPDFVFHAKQTSPFNRSVGVSSVDCWQPRCAPSAAVMLDTACSEVVWRVLATHSSPRFPLHFPSRTSPCAITFQLDSTAYWIGKW